MSQEASQKDPREFSGKIEEHSFSLKIKDGKTAMLEFDDFVANVTMNINKVTVHGHPKPKISMSVISVSIGIQLICMAHYRNVAIKPLKDLKLGLAMHLKQDMKITHFHANDIYLSASICTLVFANVTADIRMLTCEAGFEFDYMVRHVGIRLKAFVQDHPSLYPAVVDKKVTVSIGEEEMEIDSRYLSSCSKFFSGYFTSTMKEGQEGKYPISDISGSILQDCTMADFAELLALIHPYGSNSITNENVATMLDLARLYIIPTVTNKCEIFLIERMNRKEEMIENIALAEMYNLEFAKELVLACLGDCKKFREFMTKRDDFKTLPENVQIKLYKKYFEVDELNNPPSPPPYDYD